MPSPAFLNNLYYSQPNETRLPSAAIRLEDKPDILIIGGGATGLAAAWALSKSGLKITLVEKLEIGASGAALSAGMLTANLEQDFCELGPEKGEKLLCLIKTGQAEIVRIISENNIACDYMQRQGSLYLCDSLSAAGYLRRELKARQALGICSAKLLTGEELHEQFASPRYVCALYDSEAHSFNPRAFLRALAVNLLARGVKIIQGAEVLQVDLRSKTASFRQGQRLPFGVLVLASGLSRLTFTLEPALKRFAVPLRSHILVTSPLEAAMFKQLFPKGNRLQLWNNRLLYNYARVTSDNRILFGGAHQLPGVRAAEEEPADLHAQYRKLEKEFHSMFGLPCPGKADYFWGGLIAASCDCLPVLGEIKPGVYAAPFSPGITLSFASALIVAKQAMGEGLGEGSKILGATRRISPGDWAAAAAARLPIIRSLARRLGERRRTA